MVIGAVVCIVVLTQASAFEDEGSDSLLVDGGREEGGLGVLETSLVLASLSSTLT